LKEAASPAFLALSGSEIGMNERIRNAAAKTPNAIKSTGLMFVIKERG
jgi:hypothetical protein